MTFLKVFASLFTKRERVSGRSPEKLKKRKNCTLSTHERFVISLYTDSIIRYPLTHPAREFCMKRSVIVLLLLWLVGCSPSEAAVREVQLPTLAPTQAPAIDMDAAQQVAMSFLDAWQRQDFSNMYAFLSFNSQESVSFEDFRQRYTSTQNTMTLNQLSFQPRGIGRVNARTVELYYDMTFQTEVAGAVDDTQRVLTLVIDPQVDSWRVAWSTGDIFAEMRTGANLRFERRVPGRANIYDRNGEILADMNGVIVEIFVVREDIPQPDTCLPLLADATGKSTEAIQQLLDNAGANWVTRVGTIESYRYRELSERLQTQCEATFERRATRRYLRGSLMPHIIGNVGYPEPGEVEELIRQGFDAETIFGQSGIERSQNAILQGQPGGRLALYSPAGERLRVLAEASSQVAQSVWLTVDAALQEKVLEYISLAYAQNSGDNQWGTISPGAAAVVMEVDTGHILAMASLPAYDGNAFNPFPAIRRDIADEIIDDVSNNPARPQLNRATLGTYPAGSIMKVIGATAITDTGIYDLDKRYFCAGTWRYENDVRYDWWPPGHGSVDMREALKQSCNPFFYEAGFQLNAVDPMLLPNYARRMGLDELTGIGALAEAPGFIPDPEWARVNRAVPWSYADAVNMAIGQGEVDVTPLQITRLYAAIANGGTLYRPQIVQAHGILEPTTVVSEPDAQRTFDVDPAVLARVQDGLCAVTRENYGTAYAVFAFPQESPMLNPGVCGKTGTAESNQPTPHSWFVAYAPADDPEIVVTVLVENAGDGSAVAAPITRQILEYYFFLRDDA